jgi:hypothetical protein
VADRSAFWRDLSLPFYGYNRPNAERNVRRTRPQLEQEEIGHLSEAPRTCNEAAQVLPLWRGVDLASTVYQKTLVKFRPATSRKLGFPDPRAPYQGGSRFARSRSRTECRDAESRPTVFIFQNCVALYERHGLPRVHESAKVPARYYKEAGPFFLLAEFNKDPDVVA